MFKKCKVVMLPTNNKANAPFGLDINKKLILSTINLDPQHLYILSDDEIKENDWYFNQIVRRDIENHINPEGAIPIQCIAEADICNKVKCLKIIASTNYFLKYDKDLDDDSIPSISQSFIEHYVNEYNKRNEIEEVMVEYEPDLPFTCNSEGIRNYPNIKLNLDNTININPIKDSWTRDELNNSAMNFYNKYHSVLNQGDIQSITKFIDEL